MQKTRHLTDENSVFFQIFLILFSFITLGSESQISVFKQCQSNTQMSDFFWGGGSMRRSQKFLVISSLSDMFQETLFLLTRYIYMWQNRDLKPLSIYFPFTISSQS